MLYAPGMRFLSRSILTLRLPSAVMRNRLQEPQKWSDMEVMNPIWPLKPGTLNVLNCVTERHSLYLLLAVLCTL